MLIKYFHASHVRQNIGAVAAWSLLNLYSIPLPLFQMNTSRTCNLVSYSKWSCFANLNFILDISIIKSSYIESLYLDVLRHENK